MENKVTLKDVYDVVNDIRKDMQRMEDRIERRIEKSEKSIDALENFQAKTLGVLSVLAIFSSIIATSIWNRITGQN